jgi:splicing factor 3B subunit 1
MQSLVDIVKHGLEDENQKVKTITSLTIAALAEAAAPYGIESFDDVLKPLWTQIRILRGKVAPSPPAPIVLMPPCVRLAGV